MTTAEITVEGVIVDGESLHVTLTCSDRDALDIGGRNYVLGYVRTDPRYSSWGQAGVEKSSGAAAYDPSNDKPDADIYEIAKQASASGKPVVWRYRQTFRMTKMI